jgi:hypothetical protein
MRIEYRVRYFDRLAFHLVHQFLSLLLQGVLVVFALLVLASELHVNPLLLSIAHALGFYVILWLIQAAFTAAYLFTRRSDAVLTDHVMEVKDDALYDATKFNESRFFWPGIRKIVVRPGFVGIYVVQHGGFVVPNRAFKSTDERRRFIMAIKAKMVAR